jgi:signal transduction histidine kinase
MSQLFNNLLSNSLKFTQEDRQPEITIKSEHLSKADQINYGLPSRGDYVRITFSDNGIGFENNDSSRIFTLFQRLRGRSEFEGAGIGLAVCKKVVENHAGIIMASGRAGQGAVFTIILPLVQS